MMKNPIIGTDSNGSAVRVDPSRLISTRMLVQANSGGGKSWAIRVLCERLGPSIPIVILDWEGEFASLREKLDVLLVGRQGEIPTAVATAGALATQILEIGVSAVIDLYDLQPQEKRAYVRRFLESLMAAPKRLWSPRIIVVDEAHNLAPEDGQAESRSAVESLCSAGRKRQFCAVLATQRLSKLSKDSAAELNNVLIGRCTLDVDQKRAADILGFAKPDRVLLRDLHAGEFFAFGPAFDFPGVQKIKSADVTTTHGATAGVGSKPPEPSTRMRGAIAKLQDLAERSKTEVLDLDSARSTIKDLRQKLIKAEKSAPVAPGQKADQAAIDKAVASARRDMRKSIAPLLKQMRDLAAFCDKRATSIASLAEHAKGDSGTLTAMLSSFETLMSAEPQPGNPLADNSHDTFVRDNNRRHDIGRAVATDASARVMRVAVRAASNADAVEGAAVTRRHMEVLTAIRLCHAMGYEHPTRDQVSFWSRKRGGNFRNLLGGLRTAALIDYPSDGTVRAVTEGDVPDTGQAYSSAMAAIPARMRQILDVILSADGMISRDDVSAQTGKSGGNFRNLLGGLRTAGLIKYPTDGFVEAADWLKAFAGSES